MLESFCRFRSCCQITHGMTQRNVDCVMSNHNEEKTKSGETAVYGNDPALFLVLSVSC